MSFYTSNAGVDKQIEEMGNHLDKYARFHWAQYDMWEQFHAFILNNKAGSLKFYNGPSFSNSYSSSQFDAASNLSSVNFKTAQINFTVGAFGSEEEIRALIYALHPYAIDNLWFDFEPEWRYIVKLSKVGDSSRYMVGWRSDGKVEYYTELALTFDIQGDPVAIGTTPLQVKYYAANENIHDIGAIISPSATIKTPSSPLSTPFLLTFMVHGPRTTIDCFIKKTNKNFDFTATNKRALTKDDFDDSFNDRQLFSLNLSNLNWSEIYTFEYNSQTGDICLINGDKREVITLLSTYTNGLRITAGLSSTTYSFPGSMDAQQSNLLGYTIYLTSTWGYFSNAKLVCFPRTNIIQRASYEY